MFLDALKSCGSEGCVTYGAELISQNSDLLDDAASFQWLMSMSLIKEPSLAMIEAVTVSEWEEKLTRELIKAFIFKYSNGLKPCF